MFNFYIKNDNFWKILKTKPDQNTHQIAPFKIFFQGAYPQTPLAKRMAAMHSMSLCDVQISKSEKKLLPPLANPGYTPDHNCLFFFGGGEAAYYGRPLWGGQEWALAPSLKNHKKYLHVGSLLSPCCFFSLCWGGRAGPFKLASSCDNFWGRPCIIRWYP